MKKCFLSLIALCLAASLILSGCISLEDLFNDALRGTTAFEDMEYTRPDVDGLEDKAEECLTLSKNTSDVDTLMEPIYEFYEIYSDFTTNYYLAYIHYSIDMTDSAWEEEYTYCSERLASVQAAGDKLLYGLADCDLVNELEDNEFFGEGFFDDYQGESLWTDEFTRLMEQDTELQNEYYELMSQANEEELFSEAYFEEYGQDMIEIFVELVALRQQIAAEAGYADYPSFAYDFYYFRDFTPDQVEGYLEDIRTEIAPMYIDLLYEVDWEGAYSYSSERKTYRYVEEMAQAMGGTVQEAFEYMDDLGLYHIEADDNKLQASFEVFLPDYMSPFIFVNPDGTNSDQLTFAHEFGHFCNDYASYGTGVGIDVAEFFSQSMEYLSLFYAPKGENNTTLKLADSLCVYVEQSAYASFELAVYGLTGSELTAENVVELFGQTMEDFGMGELEIDPRSFIGITHFYTSPLYVISYVVSNDAAIQIYQLEQETDGAGLACLEENLATGETQLLGFLACAGLEEPFDRVKEVKELLEDELF